jgi:hypothetical protein
MPELRGVLRGGFRRRYFFDHETVRSAGTGGAFIPVSESSRMMASSSLDEGASTGDGQLMERGCGARGGHGSGIGDVRCRSRPHPTERTTVRTSRGALRSPPTATTSGRHDGWLKGGASGRGGNPEAGRGRVRAKCAVPHAVPRYRKRGTRGRKDAAAGAPTSAVTRLSEGVRRAPAIPFACRGGTLRRDEDQPGRSAAREGGGAHEPLPVIPGERPRVGPKARPRTGSGAREGDRADDVGIRFGIGGGYRVSAGVCPRPRSGAGMTGCDSGKSPPPHRRRRVPCPARAVTPTAR